MGRPNQTHERLDALLDGRPDEVTDDLAPLLAAAEALRGELAEFELDREVVDRHLEQVLDRPAAVVPLPVREDRGGGLRRRLVAVGLAAALVLVPATAASAASGSALPGQPLYPVKLAFEQFRLATVQWSATAEAHERTRLAATRLKELDRLVQLRMLRQIPSAIRALDKAVAAARVAVQEAIAEQGRDSELVAAANKLEAVEDAKLGELSELATIVNQLPPANQAAIKLAVRQSQVITASSPPVLPPTPAATTVAPQTTASQPEPSGPATTQPEPVTTPQTTEPDPVTTPTSTDPPTTTTPPTTTEAPATTTAGAQDQGNPSGAGGSEGTPPSSGP